MLAALLAALIATTTGIPRDVDPELVELAKERSIEIQAEFAHRPLDLPYWWGEVLAWNRGAPDPAAYAVEGWMSSPDHRPILTDPAYEWIGCGASFDGTTYWIVCLFGDADGPIDPAEPDPPSLLLPDTALPAS